MVHSTSFIVASVERVDSVVTSFGTRHVSLTVHLDNALSYHRTMAHERKSLFNEYEAHTQDANELSDRAARLARALFDEFTDLGYSHREISHVIQTAVSVTESELVLRAALEKRIAERSR